MISGDTARMGGRARARAVGRAGWVRGGLPSNCGDEAQTVHRAIPISTVCHLTDDCAPIPVMSMQICWMPTCMSGG